MLTTIDGFSIETHNDRFIFQRVAEPHHEYVLKLDPEPVKVVLIVPADVAHRDPLQDARRFEGEVLEVARKFRDRLFPEG
jgi:hypothetical protein